MFKDYTMNQIILPLNLEVKLDKNDIAFAVNDLVESIPIESFEDFVRSTGCPAYHPRMMMKIILCAYTQSVFSGRKIEALLKDSIRMMWLAQGYEPSYRTINRFRTNPKVAELLRQCFVQFRSQLVQENLIDEEAIFIDGTKIEANANKFTFVWRKSIEKYSSSLVEKSNLMYDELLEKEIIPSIERENEEELSIKEIEVIVEKLNETIDTYTRQIEESDIVSERKQLRAERKEPKKYRKQFADFLIRKQKYQRDMETFKDRNRRLNYVYESNRTDKYGFKRTFKVYECEDCSDCPLRSLCTKAAEGNNRKLFYNEKWEHQKEYVREKLSNEETGEIYGKRKIDVEPVFGFLKANLGFTRMSVRGKPKVHNELGFALMAVNLRKYSAINNENGTFSSDELRKRLCLSFLIITTFFYSFEISYVPASF